MAWGLILLAEMWRRRWWLGFPLCLGLLAGFVVGWRTPDVWQARAILQLQADQARAPLLQKITAPGHEQALRTILTKPELLADAGHDVGRTIEPQNVLIDVLNDNLLAVGYVSSDPAKLQPLVDNLAYNFIQALLAPERMHLDQQIAQNQDELKSLRALGDAMTAEQTARLSELQNQQILLQTNLRLVNTAFGSQGSQALIWFAETATLVPPMVTWLRILGATLLGGLAGLGLAWLCYQLPRWKQRFILEAEDVRRVTGLPVVSTLPWLGPVQIEANGLRLKKFSKSLKPADFAEVSRLQRTLLRGLQSGRGPLVLVGPEGHEGVSLLALLLAEKTALLGKRVALVDLNLKNRTLTTQMGLGDGNWELPKPKGKGPKWEALQPVQGLPKLLTLAAPRRPETLHLLGEAGGLPVLFDTLSEMVDVVIVDASPLTAFNRGNIDAVAVAVASARTVLVAQAADTSERNLERASSSLQLAGANLMGIVLNQRDVLSRRQLLSQIADRLAWLPPLAKGLRKAAIRARLEA